MRGISTSFDNDQDQVLSMGEGFDFGKSVGHNQHKKISSYLIPSFVKFGIPRGAKFFYQRDFD